MASLLRPEELKKIASDAELAKVEEERRISEEKKRQLEELRQAFMSRKVLPETMYRVNAAVRSAAQRGQRELQVLTFPCSYCTDGGERINNLDPDWPTTLEGFAKDAYAFYERELKSLGYRLDAEVTSFAAGTPSEVGLFLRW